MWRREGGDQSEYESSLTPNFSTRQIFMMICVTWHDSGAREGTMSVSGLRPPCTPRSLVHGRLPFTASRDQGSVILTFLPVLSWSGARDQKAGGLHDPSRLDGDVLLPCEA